MSRLHLDLVLRKVFLPFLLLSVSLRADILSDLARPHEGRSMRASSTHRIGPDGKYDPNGEPDPNSNWDNKNVPPGETKVLMDVEGPGVITHIWLTFLSPEPHPWAKNGSADHQEMLFRIFYDGSKRPGVEAPVGDFFANCFGKRSEVISLPVIVEDGDSYNCFWQMPFRKSVRVEIENQSEKPISLLYYNIDWIKKESLPPDTPYFYAQYRQEYPVRNGRDYLILETEGKGHYVGTVLAVRTRSPSWFGEGDEKIYIDGEKKASIWGTGTEDYFLSAWGLKTCGTPYFGTPYFDQWGIVGGHTSAYRWHINDPIVFRKGIKVTIEHWGWISPDENPDYKSTSWNEREDDYASVAFWYQTGTPTFKARAPHARERKLPNLDIIFRAAERIKAVRHGPGEFRAQHLDGHQGTGGPLPGEEDQPHSSAADQPQDLEAVQPAQEPGPRRRIEDPRPEERRQRVEGIGDGQPRVGPAGSFRLALHAGAPSPVPRNSSPSLKRARLRSSSHGWAASQRRPRRRASSSRRVMRLPRRSMAATMLPK